MDKPTLPRDVAEAIERYWKRFDPDAHFKWVQLTNWYKMHELDVAAHGVLVPFFQVYPIEYMTALVIGYEVEQSPEGEVEKYFTHLYEQHLRYQKSKGCITSPFGHEMDGVKRTLKLLNIKIEGVNS